LLKAFGIQGLTCQWEGEWDVNVDIIAAAVLAWVGQAFALSRLMERRGFHALPWLIVLLFLGPAMWPLALLDLLRGPPGPLVVRRGARGSGTHNVWVILEGDRLSEPLKKHIANLKPYSRSLVMARVVKAGGPRAIETDAVSFLHRIAATLGEHEAELVVLFGNMEEAVKTIHQESELNVVLRSDQPDELWSRADDLPKVRCLGDDAAA
jgi:hypothetical protein